MLTHFIIKNNNDISDKIRSLQTSICSWDFLPLDMEVKELVHFVCLILNQALEHPDLAEFRVSDGKPSFLFFSFYVHVGQKIKRG